MAGHHSSPPFDLSRDRTLRGQGTAYARTAAVVGLVCLGLALVVAALTGGTARIDQTFDLQHAPPALVGVVQLLADKEGTAPESYDGRPIADINKLAHELFSKELPPHWDTFLQEKTGGGWQRFQASYLVAFLFVVSLSVGGLFFILIQHLARAGWSVVLGRIAEIMAASIGLVSILALPIVLPLLFGSHSLYEWNDPHLVETDALIRHKRAWLNPTFFTIRAVLYFGVWALFSRFFLARSREQDESGDPALTSRMQAVAPIGTLLFAGTVNFFAFDFMMSVAPHWFSAIYGIYYFAASVVGGLATMILLCVWLKRRGVIGSEMTIDHFHDLGKLLFGFNFFWGYIAFSQYVLIWYANIPEETGWLILRQQNGWQWLSLTLLFGHLFIPFLGLMSRRSRRSIPSLVFWACWLLAMHWLDLYWNVLPQFSLRPWPGVLDLLLLAGLSSLFLAAFFRTASSKALVAVRDPRLSESLAFHNA
ncbi:hypothetical protein [Planctomyces sp. SH-PL14]|uniref:hypothetical protein n=1 Tax=Planctomyces sp. SH-PL14 TaxID=1632864 RepID=UPI00078D2889|nr:hypothetical protein [Planctomyces sp. SH-PL14]AMV18693.1 hypothetical protein VT03_12420 [Planctomyces sp. SH-PL14]